MRAKRSLPQTHIRSQQEDGKSLAAIAGVKDPKATTWRRRGRGPSPRPPPCPECACAAIRHQRLHLCPNFRAQTERFSERADKIREPPDQKHENRSGLSVFCFFCFFFPLLLLLLVLLLLLLHAASPSLALSLFERVHCLAAEDQNRRVPHHSGLQDRLPIEVVPQTL